MSSHDHHFQIDVETRCLDAISEMQCRGLHSSASWLGEMLMAASPSLLRQTFDYHPPTLHEPETVAIKLGESYLQSQEYKRCTSLLKNEPGFRASFLGLYALYLDGEKQKDVAGAADFAATERANLMNANNGGGVGGGAGGVGGGGFAADHQFAAGGGVSSATFGLFSSASGIHSDIPPGLRKNHHASDLDRALTSLVSFQVQHPHHHHQQHHHQDHHQDYQPQQNRASNEERGHAASYSNLHSSEDDVLGASHGNLGSGDHSTINQHQQQQQQQQHSSPPFQRDHCTDHAYLHWLHGVIRRERGLRDEAASSFVLAVSLEPLLWSAWVDLVSVVSTEAEVNNVLDAVFSAHRPRGFNAALSWIGRCFSALAKLEMQQLQSAVAEYEQLAQEFSQSAYVQSKLGCARYHRKDFPASREAFENAIVCDPLRLDGLDDFSNLLFVVGDRPRLASLAQSSYAVDPFRAETSCVAGNYFAMLRRHAQSVQHFRRAVTIDRKNSSAWTLLGHGYVEVKHTSAAVDAYNTAVEVDRRDYRAWYGLGQIFELLHLYPQALEFYRQTAAVRPHDSRMWSVIAGCLEKQNRQGEAIQCMERAEACEPSTTEFYCSLVRRLAKYYSELHQGNSSTSGSNSSSSSTGGLNSGKSSSSSFYYPDITQKAACFFNKLLLSPFSSTEDRVSALLYMAASKLFESFELLDVVPRNHSSIFSLQQQGTITVNYLGGGGRNLFANNNSNSNANVKGGDEPELAGAADQDSSALFPGGNSRRSSPASTFKRLSLPQIVGNYYFGRSHPHTSNRSSAESRKQRALSLVQEADAMMRHLRDELIRSGAIAPLQQQQIDEVGNNIFVGNNIPEELHVWLRAYEHDLDFLRQYFA